MRRLDALLLAASALFAWSMGAHYSGAVMGTAYGSGVLRLRVALPLAAVLALLGSALASVNVVDTYAHGLVRGAPRDTIAAALLTAGNHRQPGGASRVLTLKGDPDGAGVRLVASVCVAVLGVCDRVGD